MPRKSVRQYVSEMLGRTPGRTGNMGFMKKLMTSFWGSDITVDLSRSDYDLYRAIYHASVIEKKGKEYLLGAGFAKPIINSTAAFSIGMGFEVSLDGADDGTPIKDAEDDIRKWVKRHGRDWYRMAKFAFREGDAFLILHDDYSIEMCKPEDVTVIYDPITSRIIGYDIVETVDIAANVTATYTREYRLTSFRVVENKAGSETVLINRVFTDEGIMDGDTEGEAIAALPDDARLEVPLPVVHYANEVEPKSIYGMSEIQSALIYFYGYSQVLQDATKSNRYNSTPIPVIKGDQNVGVIESQQSSNASLGWGRDMVLYLKGDNAEAKYLSVPQTMEDTGKLLEYYFYLIVQTSETPEFIFGTALTGSKASAETQMPIMVKKAIRKQQELAPVLESMIMAYIHKKYAAGDQAFYAVVSAATEISITFPPIVDEDMKLTLDTIEMLVEKGIISDETALQLSVVGRRVNDAAKEVEAGRKDAELRDARVTTVYPENNDRITDELDSLNNNDDDLDDEV